MERSWRSGIMTALSHGKYFNTIIFMKQQEAFTQNRKDTQSLLCPRNTQNMRKEISLFLAYSVSFVGC